MKRNWVTLQYVWVLHVHDLFSVFWFFFYPKQSAGSLAISADSTFCTAHSDMDPSKICRLRTHSEEVLAKSGHIVSVVWIQMGPWPQWKIAYLTNILYKTAGRATTTMDYMLCFTVKPILCLGSLTWWGKQHITVNSLIRLIELETTTFPSSHKMFYCCILRREKNYFNKCRVKVHDTFVIRAEDELICH